MKATIIAIAMVLAPLHLDTLWAEKPTRLTQTKWGQWVMRPIC